MTHVKSTARLIGAATGSRGKGHESEGSAERMESMLLSNTGSHNRVGDDADASSCTRSYYFGPSTMTVSRIHRIIDHIYFAKGMGRELGEETILEPNADEAVIFKEGVMGWNCVVDSDSSGLVVVIIPKSKA
jgi:hypothetical protein